MNNLDPNLKAVLERNARVETDKAWETSFTRRIFIALITYIGAYLLIRYNNLTNPELQALIPSGAYILSTLSLPPLKKWWIGLKR
ncbi:hypothetical protein KKC44_05365 [Patescibacteria group bacterium]|nr:hypothetical protein [Patescibacteria group bacterium]MBU2260002.1 hypothetical protein [Patescibacteria group bacterium]